MKITLVEKSITNKNCYIVDVKTMTGDADDYHHVEIQCDDEIHLRQAIIATEILKRCYPNGRGGCDDYEGSYFDEYFSEEIYRDEGIQDSIKSYIVIYYDENGKSFEANIELDDEMKAEIIHPNMGTHELETMNYPKPERILF